MVLRPDIPGACSRSHSPFAHPLPFPQTFECSDVAHSRPIPRRAVRMSVNRRQAPFGYHGGYRITSSTATRTCAMVDCTYRTLCCSLLPELMATFTLSCARADPVPFSFLAGPSPRPPFHMHNRATRSSTASLSGSWPRPRWPCSATPSSSCSTSEVRPFLPSSLPF